MVFKRKLLPPLQLSGDSLTSALVGIGVNFSANPAVDPNIEDTLLWAAYEAIEQDDFRLLSLVVTWLFVHQTWINADRLIRITATEKSMRVRSFWSAFGTNVCAKDRRFAKLKKLYNGPKLNLLQVGTEFQIRRHGEDPRFKNTSLKVPANLLRSREEDILTPSELAKRHRSYRYRIMMGPSYRADMWAALDQDPSLSPAELAHTTYGSFATAWQVKHYWQLLHAEEPLLVSLS